MPGEKAYSTAMRRTGLLACRLGFMAAKVNGPLLLGISGKSIWLGDETSMTYYLNIQKRTVRHTDLARKIFYTMKTKKRKPGITKDPSIGAIDSKTAVERKDFPVALFDRLLTAHHDAHVTPVEYGNLIDQFRRSLGISASEFMDKLGMSLSTYNRWRAGNDVMKPSLHRIRDFQKLLGVETDESTTKHSVFFDEDKRITIRPFPQLLDRQSRCLEAWSFKHLLPFRAGEMGPIRNQIVDLLTDDSSKVVYHCVFLGPHEKNIFAEPADAGLHVRSRFPAMDSFAGFKKAVFQKDQGAAMNRLRGWLVNSARTAFKVGLSIHHMGTTVLVYDPEKIAKTENLRDRKVDIFYEIPHAVYERGNHAALAGCEAHVRWEELDPKLSEMQYTHLLKPILNSIKAGEMEGVREFLKNESEIEKYKVRLWR